MSNVNFENTISKKRIQSSLKKNYTLFIFTTVKRKYTINALLYSPFFPRIYNKSLIKIHILEL